MSVRVHRLDVYGADIALATTKREWKSLRKQWTFLDEVPDSAGQTTYSVCIPNKHGVSVPCLAFWVDRVAVADDPAELIYTCAHEAHHGTDWLMRHVGHRTRPADEPSAYLCGWLTRWLHEGVTSA